MLKEAFKSIKSDKNMSLNHWRYKLLHWAFGLDKDGYKWGNHEGESFRYGSRSLPNSLYTHYCPLFHLTNAIAIMSPLILSVKLLVLFLQFLLFSLITIYQVVIKIGKFVGYGLILFLRFIVSIIKLKEKWFGKTAKKLEKKAKKEKHPKYKNIWKSLAESIRLAEKWSKDPESCFYKSDLATNFARLWKINDWSQSTFGKSKSEVKKIWDEIQARIKRERLLAEKKRQKLRDRIVFWVNLSRGIIKGFFNLLYVALFSAVMFLLWTYGTVVVFGAIGYAAFAVSWIVSFNWWDILGYVTTGGTYLGVILTSLVMLFLIILGIFYLGKKFTQSISKEKLDTILLPVTVCKSATFGLGSYIGGIVVWCSEFVKMFYEENCPAINLVEFAGESTESETE